MRIMEELFQKAVEYQEHEQAVDPGQIEPIDVTTVDQLPQECYDMGLELVQQGKVAALVMSGGQGTRLGSKLPKGMLDIGLPGNPTLFELQAQRLLGLSDNIPWYIMTSKATDQPIREYFESNNHLNYNPNNITIFQQSMMPAFHLDGSLITQNNGTHVYSPGGNGGIYASMKDNGILEDMRNRGITHVFIYCVDNAIVKVCDPWFIGFAKQGQYDCANKVVPKESPDEKVGVYCSYQGKPKIIEYSDLTDELRSHPGLSTGNIGIHCLTLDYLSHCAEMDLPYHLAYKKIKYDDHDPREPNGIKLEQFIFDAFVDSQKTGLLSVNRDHEYTPIKNKTGKASPESAREQIMSQLQ